MHSAYEVPHIVIDCYEKFANSRTPCIVWEQCSEGEIASMKYLIENEPRIMRVEPPEVYQFRKEMWASAMANTLYLIECRQLVEV